MKLHLSKFGGVFTEQKEEIITNDGISIELSSDYQITADTKVSVLFKNGDNSTKLITKGNTFKVPSSILLEGDLYMYITLILDKEIQKFNCEPLKLIKMDDAFKQIPIVQDLIAQVKVLTEKVKVLEEKEQTDANEIQRIWETTEE